MNFTGQSKQRKVQLGGKSKAEESREEVLQRTRLEREKRRQAKAEQQAATCIQAHWRGWSCARRMRGELRAVWVAHWGTAGERLSAHACCLPSPTLPELLFFARPTIGSTAAGGQGEGGLSPDAMLIAAACRALLEASSTASGLAALTASSTHEARVDKDGDVNMAGPGADHRQGPQPLSQVLVHRLARLGAAALAALTTHRDVPAVRSALASPRARTAVLGTITRSGSSPSTAIATGWLVEALLTLVVPDTWTSVVEVPATPASAVATVLSALSRATSTSFTSAAPAGSSAVGSASLMRQLAQMLLVCTPVPPPAAGLPTQPAAPAGGISCAETLATQLVVRTLAAAGKDKRTPGASLLLSVPGLWVRTSSLSPIAPRLGRAAAEELAAAGAAGLCSAEALVAAGSGGSSTLLLGAADGVQHGAAGAAAALVSNLVAVGARMLPSPSPPAAAQAVSDSPQGSSANAQAAAVLAAALHALLCAIPLRVLHPTHIFHSEALHEQEDEVMGAEEEEIGLGPSTSSHSSSTPATPQASRSLAAASAAVARGGWPRLPLPLQPSEPVPYELSSAAHSVVAHGGRTLLRSLVSMLLPATPRTQPAAAGGGAGGGSASASAPAPIPPAASALSTAQRHLHGACALSALLLQAGALPSAAGGGQRLALSLALGVGGLAPRLWGSCLVGVRAADVLGPARLVGMLLPPAAQPEALAASNTVPSACAGSVVLAASVGLSDTAPDKQGSTAAGLDQWPPPGDPTASALPLILFSRSMASVLTVSDVDELQDPKRAPLPISHVWDAQRPDAGVLPLLRERLWSALWTDVMPTAQPPPQAATPMAIDDASGSGSSGAAPVNPRRAQAQATAAAQLSAAGTALATALRRELCHAGGALYGQLYLRLAASHAGGRSQGAGADQAGDGMDMQGPGSSGLLGQRVLIPASAFHASSLGPDRFAQEAAAARASGAVAADAAGNQRARVANRVDLGARIWQVLRYAPALAPFPERARLFQTEVAAAREAARDSEMQSQMDLAAVTGAFAPPRFITVHRSALLQDGFDGLNALGPEGLRSRVRIQFVDDEGRAEAGVDGGGLFKDFMEALMREGFAPERGLFAANAEHELYPSPTAYAAAGSQTRGDKVLSFLGRMLGKALWEGILLELPLASFTLKALRGGRPGLHDLPSLDAQVYRNLLALRTYTAQELSELSLTFVASSAMLGTMREVELRPGGASIPVTPDNVAEYISRVADWRLNGELGRPMAAFVAGFTDLVPPEWVAMFNEGELQALISGAESGEGAGLDIADLKAHVHYAGGYHEEHPVVELLWDVVGSFSPSHQRAFLKFITACSRPPLLGFRYLEPQVCVQMAGSVLDTASHDRLPTAATCINLLKLPPYRNKAQMCEKLLMAITSAPTFDLS